MRAGRGYGAVLAERPVRRLLAASLAGRLAFAMLPLSLVLFTTARTGSAAAAGALIAAFSATSILAPVRGRIVDRRGPPALVAFTLGCSGALVGLVLAGAADAPAGVLVAVAALAGFTVPPLGPFTRAVWGGALGGNPERLRRAFALDSAGEEATFVVAPLAVALIVAVAAPASAVVLAAGGLLAGTTAAARSTLARNLRSDAAARPEAGGTRLPPALWLAIASFVGPGTALGAINIAVPALARAAGAPARAGLVLAALALGTTTASLVAGRTAAGPAAWRPAALQAALAVALAAAAAVAPQPLALALALAAGGAAIGALFLTLYVLVEELTPARAGTRAFGWLVTANNAGIALGAALAGQVVRAHGGRSGLWLAAACALLGAPVALALGLARSRADVVRPSPERGP